jgi:diaminopimelate decarboxylase
MMLDMNLKQKPNIKGLGNSDVLKLQPRVDSEILSFLSSSKPFELVNALGSPLNILFPEHLSRTLSSFESVFEKHNLRGRTYFAHKSNSSDCVARYLSTTKSYIDISSINELRHALGSGFAPGRIQATGPKNEEFICLCLQLKVAISIDSLQELEQVMRLSEIISASRPTEILLRLSGFKNRQSKHQGKSSRFGIRFDQVERAFERLSECRDRLKLAGFAFHLDTVSALEKAIAAESCLSLFEEALDRDFEPTVLNIGGGFKLSYLEHANEWHEYSSALREAAIGARPPMTWQGNTFGLMPDKGGIRGNFNTYNFFDSSTGADFLNEILSHQIESLDNASLAKFLRDNGIELWIEPGRALLDQVGVTIARVNTVRESSQGETLVCLNMKRQDICFIDQEIFVDPLILYQNDSLIQNGSEQAVYFAGSLCLESDLVTRHQTFVPQLPETGDLVAFANTAGYFMDFSASEAIMQPIAKRVSVYNRGACFRWTLDQNYYPQIGRSKETQ